MVKKASELAEHAAIAGAHAMLAEIASGRSVTANRKDDFTFVLNLDLLSDAAIRAIMPSQYPIVSEENAASHGLLGSQEPYFLVDPLDGTNNCRRALSFFGPEMRPMQESFGPLVGYVENGAIQCATFVSLTESLVWTATRGGGCTVTQLPALSAASKITPIAARDRVMATTAPRLRECGVLFYPGRRGELDLLNKLRTRDLVDGCYRYGGFASDCTRIARAREHILLQFSLKPWDLVAGLIATEAGSIALSYSEAGVQRLDQLIAHPLEKVIIANRGCVEALEGELQRL